MTTTDLPNDQTQTVEIPERTADAVADRLSGTEFDSIDDYVAFALERLLGELDRTDSTSDRPPVPDGSDDDSPADEAVADRLESLGYL
ncbi:hypothetical protein [Haloplanus sp.]|uniref:hypothetical protein n=1 Tax=Haloplanus sp. TaxID=1961696 RepID=UPI00263690F7|nr:hypothetical protein [Haloplanus sp.]